jgi:hypothetical protein
MDMYTFVDLFVVLVESLSGLHTELPLGHQLFLQPETVLSNLSDNLIYGRDL